MSCRRRQSYVREDLQVGAHYCYAGSRVALLAVLSLTMLGSYHSCNSRLLARRTPSERRGEMFICQAGGNACQVDEGTLPTYHNAATRERGFHATGR